MSSISQLQKRATRALSKQLTYLEEQVKISGGYNADHAAMASTLARSVAVLIDSARKADAQEAKLAQDLSPDESDQAVLEYLNQLPSARRTNILKNLKGDSNHAPS